MRSSLFGRILVAVSLTAALTLSGMAPEALAAGPAAPSGLSPSGPSDSGRPVLSWSRVATADKYDVQVSTSESFGSTLYTAKTANKRVTPTINLPLATELFWRVRGVTTSGVSGAWSSTSFTLSSIAGPTLVAPVDTAELQQPSEPPLLTWDVVAGATGYTVEVDTEDEFIQPSTYTAKNTSYVVASPAPDQRYFWRVRANFDSYLSDYSETRSFRILGLPAPELISPDDSSTTQIQDSVLDWAPVPGAVRYQVRVSTDDQFNTITTTKEVKSTRYARPETLPNDQYWWQVRAIDPSGNFSPWSTSLNQFQRNWPHKPKLVYPAQGSSVTGSLFYQWDPVKHASDYRLEVAPDPSFTPGTFDTCTTKATTYATQRTTTTACSATAPGRYYWRVRPLDGPANPIVNGIYSDIGWFDYSPGLVHQVSPANGATVDVPTLRWEAFEGAEKYKVTVYKAGGSSVGSVTTRALSWTLTGNKRLDPADGPFRWSVQAIGADTFTSQVPLGGFEPSFDVTGAVPNGPTPTLWPSSPANAHDVRMPILTWDPLFHYVDPDIIPAAYYKVSIGPKGGSSFRTLADKFPYAAATEATDEFLVAGDYQWFVQAFDEDGVNLGTGPLGYFTVDPLAAVEGNTVALNGVDLFDADSRCERQLGPEENPGPNEVCNNLQQTPVLSWDRVDGAAYYMVYLYKDRDLTTLVKDPATSMKTANRLWTMPTLLADSQAGTAYYWVIRPCKSPSVCAPDPITATNAFDKRSNPISGLEERQHDTTEPLPAHGPGGPGDAPTFEDELVLSWDDYLLTNQAGNELDVTGQESTLEAASYTVQISTDPNFNKNVWTERGIDQTTYTPYADMLPEGPLYWRVQAVDSSSNALAFSLSRAIGGATQSIEKKSPTPTLLSPAVDAKVSSTPAFMWDSLNYAAKYEIQVAGNGDQNFSQLNRVMKSVTYSPATTYVLSATLDPAASPYVWRVRRVDVDGNAGAWSSIGSFSVKAAAPTLVSPLADARTPSRDSMFTWTAVGEAAKYRFERRTEGSTTTAEAVTTVGLNWAPLQKISDGRYEWRVIALDASGKAMGSTGWRNVFVDDTGPKVVTKSPASPKRKSNFVITFNEPVKGLTSNTMSIYQKGKARKLSAKVTLNAPGTKATLNPKALLRLKTYTIKLAPRITDAYGNKLAAYTWTFTIR